MLLFSLCFLSMSFSTFAQVKLTGDMKSFSHAQKEGKCLANEEVLLFERNDGVPGVITEQWYTGADCFRNDSIVRYYVDDDQLPSIQGYLFMMHGIGFYDRTIAKPWGTKWLGHIASGGGLYNTIRFPFQRNIRVTLESKLSGYLWYILRGVENYPVIIGDIQLPANAQLRLQKLEKITLPSFQYVNLANSKKSGMLFMVALAGSSADFNYLEGCYRFLNGNDTKVQYLSSGTEDFFLSAYYYDMGLYHTDDSGLTYIQKPGTMSAYKIFARDPVIFKDSFNLIWRISENHDNACYTGKEECTVSSTGMPTCKSPSSSAEEQRHYYGDVEEEDPSKVMFADTEITSYVWFYEW